MSQKIKLFVTTAVRTSDIHNNLLLENLQDRPIAKPRYEDNIKVDYKEVRTWTGFN
jgi:hypothetical protein